MERKPEEVRSRQMDGMSENLSKVEISGWCMVAWPRESGGKP